MFERLAGGWELAAAASRNPAARPNGNTLEMSVTRSLYSDPHAAVIRVYDDAGNVIQTHEHKGDFKEA